MVLKNYKNEASAILFRISQAITLLICFRVITANYGVEVYGFISLLMTFSAYFIFFDFGIISLMRSEIPSVLSLHGRDASYFIAKKFLKALFIIVGGSYIFILFFIFLFDGPIYLFINIIHSPEFVTLPLLRNVSITLMIYALLVVLGNWGIAVLSAQGKQYQYFLFMILGGLFQAAIVLMVAKSKIGFNILFSALLLPGPLVGLIVIYKEIKKSISSKIIIRYKNIFNKTSTSFFIIQFGGLITNNIDVLIVAQLYSLREVAVYSTLKLIIQVPISLHASFIGQAWPRFAALAAQNKWIEIRILFKDRMKKTILFSVITSVFFIVLTPYFFEYWSDRALEVNYSVIISFAIMLMLYKISACFSILIFSLKFVRPLAYSVIAVIPLLYGVSILGKKLGFGIESVIVANMVVQTFGLFIGIYFYFYNLKKHITLNEGIKNEFCF